MSGVGALADALQFTVPLHIAELRGRHIPAWLTREQMWTAIASRAATVFATRGDSLQFAPTSTSHYRSARQAGLALSEAIAAAALLNPGTGVDVLGSHFCAGPHPKCPIVPPADGGSAGEVVALLDEFEALLLGRDHTRQLRQLTPNGKDAA